MASCMPGSPEVHSSCFPVILHEVYFKISSLHLLVCVCVCACAHAWASLYSTAHTWSSETSCRVPSLPTMGFQDGTLRSQTLMASILTCRIISPVSQFILRLRFSLNLSSPIWYGLAVQWTPGILCRLPHPVTRIKGTCCWLLTLYVGSRDSNTEPPPQACPKHFFNITRANKQFKICLGRKLRKL